MAVSVEVYFLTNFLMDFAATAIVARSLGRVRWRRVMLAAALGAVWATLAQLPLLRFLASFGGAAAMAFVLAAVAMPPDCLRSALRAGAALLGGALFLGGVQLAAVRLFAGAGAAAFIAGALLGAMALLAATGARQKRLVTWEVQVFLSAGGGEARFRALVDTGNRPRSQISTGRLRRPAARRNAAGIPQSRLRRAGRQWTAELLPPGIVSGGLWKRLSALARPLGGGLPRQDARRRAGAGAAGGVRDAKRGGKRAGAADDRMKGA